MTYKPLFIPFIPFIFLVNSQPSKGLDFVFNPENVGYKNGHWIQQHNQ